MKALQTIARALGMVALASLMVSNAIAQNAYPKKPITVLIPFSAGGALDAVARPIGEAYGQAYGQSWIIENLGGAGGTIAAARAVRQDPDGYQLLMASSGQVSIAPFVYPSLSYNPSKDLVPIVHLADSTAVLYTNANSPYRSVADLITAAKAKPGSIDFAHTGNGSVSHLALELLQHTTGAKFVAIPYKGAGVAIGDLAGGQIPLLFTFVSTAKPMLDAGRVRPLAVASEKRLASLPEVPTFAELGIQNVIAKLWIGLMAPAGTPQPVIDTLSRQVNTELAKPAMRARLEPQGLEVKGGSPQEFRTMIANDTARWRELSQSVNLAVQ